MDLTSIIIIGFVIGCILGIAYIALREVNASLEKEIRHNMRRTEGIGHPHKPIEYCADCGTTVVYNECTKHQGHSDCHIVAVEDQCPPRQDLYCETHKCHSGNVYRCAGSGQH